MPLILCDNDALAVGKILDMTSPEELQAMGMDALTIARAEWIFEDADKHLTRVFGRDWDTKTEAA